MAFAKINSTVEFKFKTDGEIFSGVVQNYKYNNEKYNTKRRLYLADVKNVATGLSYNIPHWQKYVCISYDKIITKEG